MRKLASSATPFMNDIPNLLSGGVPLTGQLVGGSSIYINKQNLIKHAIYRYQ